ncbi:MAG: hypothetical protein NTW67_04660 [Candidatus Woesearchaeota archaeon]|nr:hypothetical protein [Candidatus Woesearchaeota archaeon]
MCALAILFGLLTLIRIKQNKVGWSNLAKKMPSEITNPSEWKCDECCISNKK